MSESDQTAAEMDSSMKSTIRAKLDDPLLDPRRLYHTLIREINKEAVYDLENDAKLRAITQGTVNYEQFRQMVLGAHIRPLEKKDKVEGCQNGKRPHVVWNTAVNIQRPAASADESVETSPPDSSSGSDAATIYSKP